MLPTKKISSEEYILNNVILRNLSSSSLHCKAQLLHLQGNSLITLTILCTLNHTISTYWFVSDGWRTETHCFIPQLANTKAFCVHRESVALVSCGNHQYSTYSIQTHGKSLKHIAQWCKALLCTWKTLNKYTKRTIAPWKTAVCCTGCLSRTDARCCLSKAPLPHAHRSGAQAMRRHTAGY